MQQLDSTMIIPTTEIGGDSLGSIPELPASEMNVDPFATPPDSATDANSSDGQPRTGVKARNADASTHVMSWSQYNSMGARKPSSRLSQPHGAPDGSAAVWSNLDPTKKEEED